MSLDVFCQFLEVIEGNTVEVTNQNISSLALLCSEFDFRS
jgi:hypothetical protein